MSFFRLLQCRSFQIISHSFRFKRILHSWLIGIGFVCSRQGDWSLFSHHWQVKGEWNILLNSTTEQIHIMLQRPFGSSALPNSWTHVDRATTLITTPHVPPFRSPSPSHVLSWNTILLFAAEIFVEFDRNCTGLVSTTAPLSHVCAVKCSPRVN